MHKGTDHFYFKGKAKWSKIIHPDLEFQNWSINLYLDPPSYDLFMKLKEKDVETEGIKNEVKKDDDGYYVTFRRPLTKKWLGKETQLTPPMVFDKDGNHYGGEIGNGSDITVKVERYSYTIPVSKKRGSAIRFNSVRIDNLVPYTSAMYTEDQKKKLEGFDAVSTDHF